MTRFENALEKAKSNIAFDGGIGTLSEKTLHSVLKYYIEPCDDFHEVAYSGFVADIMRDGCITEIQTRAFDRLRKKLAAFLPTSPVTVVFPIAENRYYTTVDTKSGEATKERKSPRRGSVYDAFKELYKIKMFLGDENLYFHFILLDVTEIRHTVKKSWKNRRGIELFERIPRALKEEIYIDGNEDFKKLIPSELSEPFYSRDFAKAIKRTKGEATTALNVLESVGAVKRIGRDKNGYLYERN